jgi:hypothetical protein
MAKWKGLALGCFAFLSILAGGCTVPPRETRFEVINYTSSGESERLHDLFDECYYAVSPSGNVDILARRVVQDPTSQASILQIVHLHTIYRAKPGTTYADSTMINGTVTYAIVVGHDGTAFEGGCFLTCNEDSRRGILTGRLEHARLSPNRRVGNEARVFEKADVTGMFRATHDPAKTISLLNELNRFFGPQPDYQRPSDKPSPI